MRISNFVIDLSNDTFSAIDDLKNIIDSKRPLPPQTSKSLQEELNLEWTYHSNGIEGNTLTLRETQVVLEGITVGGKTLREHLEAINHKEAIDYLSSLVGTDNPITEWNIKNLHAIILKNIDAENAGRYRTENVMITGATHVPPDYMQVGSDMGQLIITFQKWQSAHPLIQAALLHGELVKIHPFIDGNGRTSRLVMNLVLMNHGYYPIILKKENRLDYYNALDKAHTTADYTDFVRMLAQEELSVLNRVCDLIG